MPSLPWTDPLEAEMAARNPGPGGPWTPWGEADHVARLAYGVYWFDTPSHGGFGIAEGVAQTLLSPEAIAVGRAAPGSKGRLWYEEDQDAAIVLLEHPEWARSLGMRFDPDEAAAQLRRSHPDYMARRESRVIGVQGGHAPGGGQLRLFNPGQPVDVRVGGGRVTTLPLPLAESQTRSGVPEVVALHEGSWHPVRGLGIPWITPWIDLPAADREPVEGSLDRRAAMMFPNPAPPGLSEDEVREALSQAAASGPLANFDEDLKPQLVILVGPPASGKSWFVDNVIVKGSDHRGFKGRFPRFMSAPPSIRESDAILRRLQHEAAVEDHGRLRSALGGDEAFAEVLADIWHQLGAGPTAEVHRLSDLGPDRVRAAVGRGLPTYLKDTADFYVSMRGRHADGETLKRRARAMFEAGVGTTLRRVGDTVVIDSAGEDIDRTPFDRFMADAKAQGFTTSLVWMNAPLSLSLARNEHRARTGDRKVPPEQTIAAYEAMVRAVEGIAADPNLDRHVEYRWRPSEGVTEADWVRDPSGPAGRGAGRMYIFDGGWAIAQDERLSLKRRMGRPASVTVRAA